MNLATKNKIIRIVLPIITAAVVLYIIKSNEHNKEVINNQAFEERFGPVMGTSGYVKIIPTSKMQSSAQDAFAVAYKATKHAEALLSRYNKSSDISKINLSKAGEKIQVAPLTWQMLMESRRFYMLSNHAFDPALGALIDIYPWKERNIDALPDQEIISSALANSGFDKISFIRDGMYVSKTNSSVTLDLGGIAKGFGVNIMAESLREQGVESAIIEIGGEIAIIGSPDIEHKSTQVIGSAEKIWTTGIKNPRGNGVIKKFASEGGVSIATSGDYEKYFTVGNKRYSHIIDPRTGYPTEGGIISATIITRDSCTTADALATAVSVLGVEKSKKLLRLYPETTAYLILNDMTEVTITGGLEEEEFKETVEKDK